MENEKGKLKKQGSEGGLRLGLGLGCGEGEVEARIIIGRFATRSTAPMPQNVSSGVLDTFET